MRISKPILTALSLATLGLVSICGTAQALDAGVRSTASPFKSETEAFASGMRDYNAGNKATAASALEYAATKGHTRAMWKLGRMYADGDGVGHDDLKAFEYFSKIADDNADIPPGAGNTSFAANAFVALGRYFLQGIDNTYVKPDPHRAYEMFYYAATYFGDPAAQFHLGRLYLDGIGVPKNVLLAARWFNLSAQKGYPGSQALLGHLLIVGHDLPHEDVRGLVLLKRARDGADVVEEAWIIDLCDKTFASADEATKRAALSSLEESARKP